MARHGSTEPAEPPASKPAERSSSLPFQVDAEAIGQALEGQFALLHG